MDLNSDSPLAQPKIYRNSNASVGGPNEMADEDEKKRQLLRAKRFGISEKPPESLPERTIVSFDDVEIQSLKLPPCTAAYKGEPRLNSILIHGADTMSTKDVFEYFVAYQPEALEWVDDLSCVVVWSSNDQAKAALDGLSRPLSYFVKVDPDEETSPSEDSGMEFDGAHKQETFKLRERHRHPSTALAFGTFGSDVWRIGLPTSSKHQLYFRQATQLDRKVVGAANRSLYYLKYGKNGNLLKGGSQGIISTSRKRRVTADKAKVTKKMEVEEKQISNEDNNMEIDDESPDEINPIELYTTFSKGEKRLKMYSDEPEETPVFQRLTAERTSKTVENRTHVDHGDLREKLRQKRLQKEM